MSVEIESPVHSSSIDDDFASLLEDELESEYEAEFDNHRSNRRKFLEQLETVEEIETVASVTLPEEISSSKGKCEHPGSFGNMCFVCGEILESTGVPLRYIHKDLSVNQDENSRMRDSHMRWLQSQRKLCLVLDLDHTLLNSTPIQDLRAEEEEEYLKSDTHSGNLFTLGFMGTMTKLRPFVHTFLREASEMFEMYIYTMGDKQYAGEMAKLLDPKRKYFGEDRIISRDDSTVKDKKSLDVVLGHESCVVILDDTENVWQNHKENLILTERYLFFASSCEHGRRFQSLSQMKTDESETDGILANLLNILKKTHGLYFKEDGGEEDVRSILKELRKEILRGCKLVLIPEDQRLWKMAEGLGATCTTVLDASVTHVVAMDVGREKVRCAKRKKKFVVHRGWIYAANYLWKKQPEENFRLEQLKK